MSCEEGWEGWDETTWDEGWDGYDDGEDYDWDTGDSWLEHEYWEGHGDAAGYDEEYCTDPLGISTDGTPNP